MNRLVFLFSLLVGTLGANVALAFDGPRRQEPIDLDSPPAWFRDGSKDQNSAAFDRHVIKGRVSSTRKRAFEDAGKRLDAKVSEWLVASGLPQGWKPPQQLIESMIVDRHCEPVRHELGVEGAEDYETLYVAAYNVDFSRRQHDRFVHANRQEIKARRLK